MLTYRTDLTGKCMRHPLSCPPSHLSLGVVLSWVLRFIPSSLIQMKQFYSVVIVCLLINVGCLWHAVTDRESYLIRLLQEYHIRLATSKLIIYSHKQIPWYYIVQTSPGYILISALQTSACVQRLVPYFQTLVAMQQPRCIYRRVRTKYLHNCIYGICVVC